MIRHISHKPLWPALGAGLLGITLAGCGGNSADNTAATAPDAAPSTPANTAPANVGAPGGTTVTGAASASSFASVTATWSKIMAATAALDAVIKANKLDQVHEAAFNVRDIVKTLPAQSQALAPDKQKTLAAQVKNIEQLASKLDEAGDSKNIAATKDNRAGLGDALDIIKSLYPAGTIK